MKLYDEYIKYILQSIKPDIRALIYTSLVCLSCLFVYVFGLVGNYSFLTLIFATTFSLVVNGIIIGNIYSFIIIAFCFIFSYTDIFSSVRYDYIDVYIKNVPIYTIVFWYFAIHVFFYNQKYKYKRANYKRVLETKIEEGNKQLSKVSYDFIDTLYEAYTVKNPREMEHSKNVAMFSQAIARKYTEDDEFSFLCYKAGLLHDIGKIRFSDDFFNKTEYTEEEYQLYKTHVLFGSDLFSKFMIEDISLAVKYHHEKYNGSGYPEGLKGDQIPIIAQIVGLADEMDSLGQHNCNSEIIKILLAKADKEYSKNLVDIAIGLLS